MIVCVAAIIWICSDDDSICVDHKLLHHSVGDISPCCLTWSNNSYNLTSLQTKIPIKRKSYVKKLTHTKRFS